MGVKLMAALDWAEQVATAIKIAVPAVRKVLAVLSPAKAEANLIEDNDG